MPTIDVFWESEPDHQSELDFLARLRADLAAQSRDALILVNFHLTAARQVDCLVVFPGHHMCHVELKHYVQPLIGDKNGPWRAMQPDGSLQVIEGQNPYAQASRQRFALSDDLRSFAEGNPGAPHPPGKKYYRWFDSVVCIFPVLAESSSVPSDYKVKTLGYKELLALLTNSTQRFPWGGSTWLEFIRYLGLTRTGATPKGTLTSSDAHSLVETYRQEFFDFYSRGLHEHVPTPLFTDDPTIDEPDVPALLRASTSVQLLGVSGSGKSHLATHTVLAHLDEWVPIFVRAGMYGGRLSNLLDRSVAPLTTQIAQHILNAATQVQAQILLIVDGFNECPAKLQEQLLSDLAALFRRHQPVLLLTSQSPVALPSPINATTVTMGSLDPSERQAILASYGAPEIRDMSEPFQTAYELSIAAECVNELKHPVTRAQLFDAFIRRNLDGLSSPAVTRVALRQVALGMDEKLTAALPIDEVWRCAERALASQSASLESIDNLFRCRLVRMQQGSFAFSHELLGRFLTGEALLLANSAAPDRLVHELERPRHADLPELVIPLETRASALRMVMAGLADAELFLKSLDDECGKLAADIANREALATFATTTELMDEVSLIFQDLDSFPHAELDRDGLSMSGSAILAAASKLLPSGRFLNEALALFDATDRALHRAAHAAERDGRHPLPPSALVSAIVGIRTDRRQIPAAILIEGCSHARYDFRFRARSFEPVNVGVLEPLIQDIQPQSYSRLYFLCHLLEAAEATNVVHLVPIMLQKCWDSGAYHLRLQGLETTQHFCREASGPVREEIIELLDGFDVQYNIILSSTLVEVLSSYGVIEPPGSTEAILNEIHTLLNATPNEEAYQLAHGIYSSQFEDVVAAPYCEAIAALSDDERLQLLTLAAQGARDSFFVDTILHTLLQARDPRSLPAFEHWVRRPKQGFMPQEETACYSLAIQGLAYLQASPPSQSEPANDNEAAWQCYGQLIFWLFRPGISSTQIAEHCTPIWNRLLGPLSRAAADPLYQLAHAWSLSSTESSKGEDTNSHRRIVKTFPDEVRRLLENALGQIDSLTSIYHHLDQSQLAQYVLEILGTVGNEATISRLAEYVEDPRLGRSALQAIKSLRN